MNSHSGIITKRYTLETLSPVHIGLEKKDYGDEIVKIGGTLYAIDADKLRRELFKRGGLKRVEHFVDYCISNMGSKKYTLNSLLEKFNMFNPECIKKISKAVYKTPYDTFDQGCYIPGSSIKGAIRTAVLWKMTSANAKKLEASINSCFEKYERNKDKKQLRKDLKNYINKIDNSLHLSNIFRCIKISDTEPMLKKETGRINLYSNDKEKESFDNRCLYLEGKTSFAIQLDQKLLDRININIPFKNIDDLLAIVREFTKCQWEKEKKYTDTLKSNGREPNAFNILDNFYQKDLPSMRLGYGTGMLGTTINLLFADDIKQKIRNTFGKNRGNAPAPKSRRIIEKSDGTVAPLGWIKIYECGGK